MTGRVVDLVGKSAPESVIRAQCRVETGAPLSAEQRGTLAAMAAQGWVLQADVPVPLVTVDDRLVTWLSGQFDAVARRARDDYARALWRAVSQTPQGEEGSAERDAWAAAREGTATDRAAFVWAHFDALPDRPRLEDSTAALDEFSDAFAEQFDDAAVVVSEQIDSDPADSEPARDLAKVTARGLLIREVFRFGRGAESDRDRAAIDVVEIAGGAGVAPESGLALRDGPRVLRPDGSEKTGAGFALGDMFTESGEDRRWRKVVAHRGARDRNPLHQGLTGTDAADLDEYWPGQYPGCRHYYTLIAE